MDAAHQKAQCAQERAAQGLQVVHEPARCGHQDVDCGWLQPGRRIQLAARPCISGLQARQGACLCSQGVSPTVRSIAGHSAAKTWNTCAAMRALADHTSWCLPYW